MPARGGSVIITSALPCCSKNSSFAFAWVDPYRWLPGSPRQSYAASKNKNWRCGFQTTHGKQTCKVSKIPSIFNSNNGRFVSSLRFCDGARNVHWRPIQHRYSPIDHLQLVVVRGHSFVFSDQLFWEHPTISAAKKRKMGHANASFFIYYDSDWRGSNQIYFVWRYDAHSRRRNF